jgi:hypothetical protein
MATYTDNFNRADETPIGGSWTQGVAYNAMKLVSNIVAANGTTATCSSVYQQNLGADQYSQFKISQGTGYCGPVCRRYSTNNMIAIHAPVTGGTHYFYGPNWTGRGSYAPSSFSWATNDVMRMVCVGTAVKIQKNGSDVSGLSWTESTATDDGYGGLGTSGTTSLYLDDWEGGSWPIVSSYIKSICGVARASIKSIAGVPIASVKSVLGVS